MRGLETRWFEIGWTSDSYKEWWIHMTRLLGDAAEAPMVSLQCVLRLASLFGRGNSKEILKNLRNPPPTAVPGVLTRQEVKGWSVGRSFPQQVWMMMTFLDDTPTCKIWGNYGMGTCKNIIGPSCMRHLGYTQKWVRHPWVPLDDANAAQWYNWEKQKKAILWNSYACSFIPWTLLFGRKTASRDRREGPAILPKPEKASTRMHTRV